MMWGIDLWVNVEVSDPDGTGYMKQAWFLRRISLPFVPYRDLELDLDLNQSKEGENLTAHIYRVVWDHKKRKFVANAAIYGLGKFEGRDALSVATNWFTDHKFEPQVPAEA